MRKFLFISAGIIFLAVSAGLIIIGTGENDSFMLTLFAMAVPFLFIAYWNFYTVYYENVVRSDNSYFTYRKQSEAGIGAFYSKHTVIPVFLCLFISASIAIITAFVSAGKNEEIALVLLAVSFSACLVITLVYTAKLKRNLSQDNGQVVGENTKSSDEAGFKIAFFFASVATLGLFPLGYFIYRAVTKKHSS